MLVIVIAIIGLILYLCRKSLARGARKLAKRAGRALWNYIKELAFGHCRTCTAIAVPFHTCVVKTKISRPAKSTAKALMDKRDARAVKNGWMPPATKLKTIEVSHECAAGMCELCSEPTDCQHCDHAPVPVEEVPF